MLRNGQAVAGALAYTAYYLSFFTGGMVIVALRRRHGANKGLIDFASWRELT